MMSSTRIATFLLALAGWFTLTAAAKAQREIHHIPPHISHEGTNADLGQPFVDFDTFEGDYQFFAPADLGDFGKPPKPRTGWFGQYDRVYIWMTRPEQRVSYPIDNPPGPGPIFFPGLPRPLNDNVPFNNDPGPGFTGNLAHTEGDFTWGHRLDLGYMSCEDHGWLFTGWHINGPNEDRGFHWTRDPATNQWNWLRAERSDRINDDTGEILPTVDRNNFYTGAREFIMHESLNVADLSGFELNKLFRLKPLHHHSVIEPFFGFRYIKFVDLFRRMRYNRFTEDGLFIPVLPPPGFTLDDVAFDHLSQDISTITNHMVGGQLGVRWFKNKGHWNLSSQFRMFAGQNFQAYSFQRDTIITQYDGLGGDIVDEQAQRYNHDENANEFVLMGEVRAEAAYYVTRDVAFQVGVEVMHFGLGIGRGVIPVTDPAFRDEDVTLVGATFGFTFNR